jgi:hypothetical protein
LFTLPSESGKNTRNRGFELCLTLFPTLSKQQITGESKEIRERDNTKNLSWFIPQFGITFSPFELPTDYSTISKF